MEFLPRSHSEERTDLHYLVLISGCYPQSYNCRAASYVSSGPRTRPGSDANAEYHGDISDLLWRVLRRGTPGDDGQDRRRGIERRKYSMEAVYSDPETGLRLDRPTRRLILTFLGSAFLLLAGGAIAALLVVLTRAPAIELLWPSAFHMALTFHGIL